MGKLDNRVAIVTGAAQGIGKASADKLAEEGATVVGADIQAGATKQVDVSSEEDVKRLETILRLQRDEFLPLRVIRQELASPASRERKRRRALDAEEGELDLDELCERAGIDARLAGELEDFGLLSPQSDGGAKRYSELEADIAAACGRLAHYGIAPRHLRSFRTAADREAGLVEQIVGPALRSRNPERRRAGTEDLEALAALTAELSQLLSWRALRRVAST